MRRTVRLCLFNLEELGMVGSFYHVAQMVQARADEDDGSERVVGMICLDMLGYFTDEPGSQTSPIKAIPGVFEPPTVGDFIAVVGLLGHHRFNQSVVDAMVEASPGAKVWLADFSPIPLPDMMRSDHAAFLLAGVAAVMVTDTANFRNPHYHTGTDAVGTLDAARFTAVVRGLVGAVYALAGPVQAEGDDPADPTTTASATAAMSATCSGVLIPKPTATGNTVWRLIRATDSPTDAMSGDAAPVIPLIET